jgi:hypothetical protein
MQPETPAVQEIWDKLTGWPFADQRKELEDQHAFDTNLPPVFFVGDPAGSAEFLGIGLKPGRNLDETGGFGAETAALLTSFATYQESRRAYFLSDGLNRRHYWPIAKQIAEQLSEPRPSNLGRFLQAHLVQAELFPFFSHSNLLRDEEWIRLRRETAGGRLAAEVLDHLVRLKPWKAIIVRYSVTVRVFSRLFSSELVDGVLVVDGRRISVIALTGQSPSFPELQRAQRRGRKESPRPHPAVPTHGFFADSSLGLRNSYGRRWAVTQSFALGGTVESILDRAETFYYDRCTQLGQEPTRDIHADRKHLGADGFYAKHFRKLGWVVTLNGICWTVRPPAR